jgi:hypothetical protein
VRTLKQELKELEGLQSLLTQWTFANALCSEVVSLQKENAEQAIYDRGLQVMELKEKLMDIEANSKAAEQTKLLDTVLTMEYAVLQRSEDDLLTSSAYLADVERALGQASNRLALGEGVIVDPTLLQEGIVTAVGFLDEIRDMLSEDSSELGLLAANITELTAIMEQERSEIQNFQNLLGQALQLSNQERGGLVERALQLREVALTELILD